MRQPTEDPGTPLTNAVIARLPRLGPQIESFVPDGWDAALAQALEAIALLSEETGTAISIAQFKEKFGDLRIYVRMDEPSIGPLETESLPMANGRLPPLPHYHYHYHFNTPWNSELES